MTLSRIVEDVPTEKKGSCAMNVLAQLSSYPQNAAVIEFPLLITPVESTRRFSSIQTTISATTV